MLIRTHVDSGDGIVVRMRRLGTCRWWAAGLLVSLIGLGLMLACWPMGAKVVRGEMMVAQEVRTYRIALPTRGESARPVVFTLHGALDTTDEMAQRTGLDELASRHGAIVVYLQGRLLNWPPSIPAEDPTIADPDFAFFRKMCDFVEAEYDADPGRIYLVGVSQGGAMVNVMVANCSDRIAAAVCNCGWLPGPLGENVIVTSHKCPILYIVGDQDTQVPEKTVREGERAFAAAGHPTKLVVLRDHGHGWGRGHGVNDLVWTHLSGSRRHGAVR